MAQTCVPTPTLTTNDVSMAHSYSTTTSVSTSTAPGAVFSTVIRTCSVDAPSGVTTTCVPTLTTLYTTRPGSTVVVTVPVTVEVDYPVTVPVTLYGSSCTTYPGYVTPTDTTTSTSTEWLVSTPSPTVITSSSIVTSDGSTFTTLIASTSTFAATSVPVVQTGTADHSSGQKKSNIIGPIVGGVLGGLVALLLIGFITWKLIKRHTYDDIFNTDHHHDKIIRDPDPKAYDYGPLSQQATDLPPMPSPPPPPQSFNDVGSQPSQLPAPHHRNPSLVPLLGVVGASAAVAGTVASSSQPASSDSRPLNPMFTQAAQGLTGQAQGYPPSSYPPALHNYQGASQPYGAAANTQGGYNAQGFASASGQATGSVPTSSLVPSPSMGSATSNTTSSWGGSSTGPYQPPIIPIIGGPAQHNQQQQYEDPYNRTGSPVSIHEQRILQLANPETSSYHRGSIYDPNAYYVEAGTSSSAGPSSVSGSSSAPRDGKGRPLVLVGEKAPIVHLDGGVYEQQPEPVAVVQTGSAPPAYTV